MIENSRVGTDAVNAKSALSDIAKYAYSQRSALGTGYALMMVMTEYVYLLTRRYLSRNSDLNCNKYIFTFSNKLRSTLIKFHCNIVFAYGVIFALKTKIRKKISLLYIIADTMFKILCVG